MSLACGLALIGASAAYSSESIVAELDGFLRAYEQIELFSGAVLVVGDGRALLSKGYGMSDYGERIPNSPNTRFRIGSLTKAFTAMAVMQLEDRKALSFSDTLAKFIPDYPDGDEITIHHLLTNSSGIVDHTELPGYDTDRRVRPCALEETIGTFKHKPLNFEPGTKFEYSNSNYILLGRIIEECSGQSYGCFLDENVFEPLGMNGSSFEYSDRTYDDFARGYTLIDGGLAPARERVMANGHASGAIFSTIEDMFLWDRALHSDKLTSSEKLQRMFEPFRGGYAYGWVVGDHLGRKAVRHAGETDGFNAMFSRYPDEDVSIIILANLDRSPVDRISEGLASIVFGMPYELPKKALTGEEIYRNYPDYVGEYRLTPTLVLTIAREGDRLFCQATGQRKLELHAESASEFFLREARASISFVRDGDGNVSKLILHQAGKDIPAAKMK